MLTVAINQNEYYFFSFNQFEWFETAVQLIGQVLWLHHFEVLLDWGLTDNLLLVNLARNHCVSTLPKLFFKERLRLLFSESIRQALCKRHMA